MPSTASAVESSSLLLHWAVTAVLTKHGPWSSVSVPQHASHSLVGTTGAVLRAVVGLGLHPLPSQAAAPEAAPHAVLQGLADFAPSRSSSSSHFIAAAEPPGRHRASVVAAVTESVSVVLGAEVGLNEQLFSAGLDSLSAVELRNLLSQRLGLAITSTLAFDRPTVFGIVDWICAKESGDTKAPSEPELPQARAAFSAVARPRESRGPTVAVIVAHSGRLSSGQMADLLGGETIERVDFARFDSGGFGAAIGGGGSDGGDGLLSFGGASMASCMTNIDLFDNALFRISAGEAVLMDSQQR